MIITNQNYRPIFVLPGISKIFENVMHTQLIEYFTDNSLSPVNNMDFDQIDQQNLRH